MFGTSRRLFPRQSAYNRQAGTGARKAGTRDVDHLGAGRVPDVRGVNDGRRRSLGWYLVAVAVLMVPLACTSGGSGSSASGTGVSSAVSTAPDDRATTASTARALALDEELVAFVGSREGGVAVLIVRDGTTSTAATGFANAAGDPVRPVTPFRVGSISKSFVATMILQLVDEGRIELDEALSTYLPDTPIGAEVTIRALLSHRSGLPNFTDIDAAMSDVLADRTRQFTPDEVVGFVDGIPASDGDQRFAYSNTNYILLGQLIEQVAGTDLNTALHDRITGPLGLDATRFAAADDTTSDGLAAGWSPGVLDGDPDADYASIASAAWAAGALISTVGELATFLAELFAGTLISDEALTEMTTTGPEGYGLGLFVASFGPELSGYGHNGSIFGYTAVMAIDPATGATIVIVTNNDELSADRLAARILMQW